MLAGEPFAKALHSSEAYVFANNNLCGKSFSSLKSQTKFDEIFKITSAPFFNLLSRDLHNFTFKRLH